MADIFISYSRADREKIRNLANALESRGKSIWWDTDIHGGARFAAEIAREVEAADVVIVAWSENSVGSEWVLDEAAQGRDDGKLAPIILDDVLPPLGFRQRQAISFASWGGKPDAPEVNALLHAIEKVCSGDVGDFPAPARQNRQATTSTRAYWLAAAVVAIFIAVVFVMRTPSAENTDVEIAAERVEDGVGLAVLPFVNMSSDPEQEYFTDGLTEELLNWLANVEGLNVPGRSTSFAFKGKTEDLRGVAADLGVQYLLEGSVRLGIDGMRITAQLIEADTGFHLWSETYDRKLEDIFAIQDDVARQVVTELLGSIPESGAVNPAAVGDVDPHAHELYLEGRAQIARRRWRAAFAKFYEATQIDPNHALAHAYVAYIAAQFAPLGFAPDNTTEDYKTILQRSLAKAVQLRPDSADVLFAQGWALEQSEHNIDPDSPLAQRILDFYDRAIRANPRHVDALHATVHLTQDEAETIEIYKRVLEIDRGHAAASTNLATTYFDSGDRESARQLIEETVRLFPNAAPHYSAGRLRIMGFVEDAFEIYLHDCCDSEENVGSVRRTPVALADLGAVEEAIYLFRKIANKESGLAAKYWINSTAAYLEGDRQARADWMRRAYEVDNPPSWVTAEFARALIVSDEPALGLQLILAERPDLTKGNQPKIRIGSGADTTDFEAYAAARAFSSLGDANQAGNIWHAALEALPKMQQTGWRGDIAAAIIYANTGEQEKAFAALGAAYENGFRFLYSFDFDGGIEKDFYQPDGYFAPIYEMPEFQRFRTKIEKENAEMLAQFDKKFGFLDGIRAEMMADGVDPTAL